MADGRIIDVLINPHTNLPLFWDFVCSEAEKKEFGASYANTLSTEQFNFSKVSRSKLSNMAVPKSKKVAMSTPSFDDLNEEQKILHYCGCSFDIKNRNLPGP